MGAPASPETASRIHGLRGGGVALPDSERAFFEPRLRRDLSDVRIHTDARAAETARSVGARAFTVGRDVVFDHGEFRPGTREGRQVLAHELTHVLQQDRGASRLQRLVRANLVSCNNPSIHTQTIVGTATPVGVIDRADRGATHLIENVVDELTRARAAIVGGAPIGSPALADVTANSILKRFRINPHDPTVWTGTGFGTVFVLIRRFQAALDRLNGGSIFYTCLGPRQYASQHCRGAICNASNILARTCPGVPHIWLCKPWWGQPTESQVMTIVHELFHINFGVVDRGNLRNAHCYEEFAADINDIPARNLCPSS